jgi:hypothetical protein
MMPSNQRLNMALAVTVGRQFAQVAVKQIYKISAADIGAGCN